MMGGMMGDAGDEVEKDSKRMGWAIAGFCFAPVLMFILVICIGWNEKYTVCQSNALAAAESEAVEASCDNAAATDGKLVFMSCAITKPTESLPGPGGGWDVNHVGYCIKTSAEQHQCKETAKTTTTGKGNNTKKTTTYTYSKAWGPKFVDSSNFKDKSSTSYTENCGNSGGNPPWASGLPENSEKWAASAKAGAWSLTQAQLRQSLKCDAKALEADAFPTGYTFSAGYYNSISPAHPDLGANRVKFRGDDVANAHVTSLGKNNGGTIEKWEAPASWLCSGSTVSQFRAGKKTKKELFEALKGESTASRWVFRILFWLLLWCACTLLGEPLEAAAECVPCCGDALGDFVEVLVCVVTCPISLACCMIVAGIVWVAMRPLVGGPMFLIGVCFVGGSIAFWAKQKQKRKEEKQQLKAGAGGGPPPVPVPPAGGGGPPPLPVAPPAAQPAPGDAPDESRAAVTNVAYTGPVENVVARNFLTALRGEYIDGKGGAVGDFFSANADAEGVLAPFEDQCRDAEDKDGFLNGLEGQWGLISTE